MTYKLPKGYSIEEKKDRAKPFILRWRADKKKYSESFAKKEDAIEAAIEKDKSKIKHGNESKNLSPALLKEFLNFRKIIGNAKLNDVASCWLKYGINREYSRKRLNDAITAFIERKTNESMRRDTLTHYKKNLGRFADYFGNCPISEIEGKDLDDWIAFLLKDFAQDTVAGHRKDVRTFFNFCVSQEWISSNPIKGTQRIKIERDAPQILTPEEAKKLMTANRDHSVIAYLALGLFAGIRSEHVARFQKNWIHEKDKSFEIPVKTVKDGGIRTVIVTGFPENVWKWLKCADATVWKMTERQIESERSKAFIRAGVERKKNCLRHSFCTYHAVHFGNIFETMTLSTHLSPRIFRENYYGRARAEDAKKFWKIMP